MSHVCRFFLSLSLLLLPDVSHLVKGSPCLRSCMSPQEHPTVISYEGRHKQGTLSGRLGRSASGRGLGGQFVFLGYDGLSMECGLSYRRGRMVGRRASQRRASLLNPRFPSLVSIPTYFVTPPYTEWAPTLRWREGSERPTTRRRGGS